LKAGNPAISLLETRGFPTPPHDGCGFFNFLVCKLQKAYYVKELFVEMI
jgi:hypothetical protein